MKLLIVDNLPDSEGKKIERLGGARDITAFSRTVAGLEDGAELHTFSTTDGREPPEQLEEFAGLIWTGSPLSVNDDEAPVKRGRKLMEAAMRAEVPCLGSCWGLQLAAVVLGGKVGPARQGPQVKIETSIRLTEAGRDHPMMSCKPPSYHAVQVHNEEITRLPSHARCLATSSSVEVEAAEIVSGGWRFWGTQYHPELGLRELAAELDIEAPELVEKKAYSSREEIAQLSSKLREYTPEQLRQVCGYDDTVLNDRVRTLEIGNWLLSVGRS